ncbi:MAG: hypothetical protein AAGL66_05715 [Pseudomonadota bacterium]
MKPNSMSVALAAAVSSAVSGGASAGEYLSGDFHNHTTCSDGSTNVEVLTEKSLSYLDWFIHVGHSGSGSRDCRISDFNGRNRDSAFGRGLWANTIGDGPGVDSAAIKGDYITENRTGGIGVTETVERMWRWQSLQEFNLPSIVVARELPGNEDKEAFMGLEWVVPGHEHSSNAISTGQYLQEPNGDAMAQYSNCFARNSDDTSGGGGQGWTCELSEEGNAKLIELFDGREVEGVADYNSTLVNGINTSDAGEHVKSTAAVLWMQENFPGEAFAVQAHVERQGAFIEDDDEGYNVEHMRDWNYVAPDVAFGFESEPGHQAQYSRGSYNAGRPTSGLWTFGGVGCYAGAEAAMPGMDFDGNMLTPSDFLESGAYPEVDDNEPPAKVTLCRPGVRTMWDAMLSEGRHFWYFASSDWHNRGGFGPLDFESTNDFWPGEYQEHFTYLDGYGDDPAKAIVDSLRSGNSFAVQGQLITNEFSFTACSRGQCATMGETLYVRPNQQVTVLLEAVDPGGENNSPYAFDNPALMQVDIAEPVNEPSVKQIDIIKGSVGELFTPADPKYFDPLAPDTTYIAESVTFDHGSRRAGASDVRLRAQYKFKVSGDSYVRARGTNMPAGTPYVTDMDGNSLPDNLKDNILCESEDCPPHVFGVLTADLEAWSILNFHSNPIFIKVEGDNPVE